ncbi:MAG: hypothetical protein Q4D61_04320 [Cardiobacteriaceae bacterium]|nr:hypothetical protein [Cardiobacteriaceae bacterium]
MRHHCPHCQLPHAVSFARKSVLGFASSALCRHCGLKITVHTGYALLAMLPPLLLVAAIFLRMVRNPGMMVVLGIGAWLLYLWLHAQVPLVRAEVSKADAIARARERADKL